jgi:hypothetical protein
VSSLKEFFKKEPSNFITPFSPDKVVEISFTIGYGLFHRDGDKVKYKACVKFRTHQTTAYHRMEAEDFVQLQLDTEAFIKSL